MKYPNKIDKNGDSQTFLLLVMALLVIILAFGIKLVQTNQDTRSKAESGYELGHVCSVDADCQSTKCLGGHCIDKDSNCNSYSGETGCNPNYECLQSDIVIANTTYKQIYECQNPVEGKEYYHYTKEWGCIFTRNLYSSLEACTAAPPGDTCYQTKDMCLSQNGGDISPSPTVIPTISPEITVLPTIMPTLPIQSPKISFKFSLSGIKPNAVCKSNLVKDIKINIISRSNNISEEKTVSEIKTVDNKVNKNGDQVYLIEGVVLKNEFKENSNENNVVRVKGVKHSQMRYCKNDQASRVIDDTVCSIKLDGTIYDFSNYPVLPGDVTGEIAGVGNGIVNGQDYSYIKSRISSSEVDCNKANVKEADLNGDGVVNGIDMQLIKNSLGFRDDE